LEPGPSGETNSFLLMGEQCAQSVGKSRAQRWLWRRDARSQVERKVRKRCEVSRCARGVHVKFIEIPHTPKRLPPRQTQQGRSSGVPGLDGAPLWNWPLGPGGRRLVSL